MAGERSKLIAQFGSLSNIRSKNDIKLAIRIINGINDIEYPDTLSIEEKQAIRDNGFEQSDAMAEIIYHFVMNNRSDD